MITALISSSLVGNLSAGTNILVAKPGTAGAAGSSGVMGLVGQLLPIIIVVVVVVIIALGVRRIVKARRQTPAEGEESEPEQS